MGEAGAKWLEACTVVQDLCGPGVRLRILDKQAPLPHWRARKCPREAG